MLFKYLDTNKDGEGGQPILACIPGMAFAIAAARVGRGAAHKLRGAMHCCVGGCMPRLDGLEIAYAFPNARMACILCPASSLAATVRGSFIHGVPLMGFCGL